MCPTPPRWLLFLKSTSTFIRPLLLLYPFVVALLARDSCSIQSELVCKSAGSRAGLLVYFNDP
jgi:hypothetical protein